MCIKSTHPGIKPYRWEKSIFQKLANEVFDPAIQHHHSEKMFRYANSILKQDGIKYKDIKENTAKGSGKQALARIY